MPAPFSVDPVGDWLNLIQKIGFVVNKPRRQPWESVKQSCVIPGTDDTSTQTLTQLLKSGPLLNSVRQLSYDVGIPVLTTQDIVTLLQKNPLGTLTTIPARTVRPQTGTFTLDQTIEVPANETLTIIIGNNVAVQFNVDPGLGGPAFELKAGSTLVFLVQAGSSLTITDPRAPGVAPFLATTTGTGETLVIDADLAGAFAFGAPAGNDFVQVPERPVVDSFISGQIRGAIIDGIQGNPGANAGGAFVRTPANALAQSQDGFNGIIERSYISYGTVLLTAAGVVTESTIDFARRADLPSLNDSAVNAAIEAVPANQPPVFGDARPFLRLRGSLDRVIADMSFFGGPALAPFRLLQVFGRTLTDFRFTAAGATGALATVEGMSGERMRVQGLSLDLLGLPDGAEAFFNATNGLTAADVAVTGTSVFEASGPAVDSVRLTGITFTSPQAIRLSHAARDVTVVAGNIGAGPFPIDLPGGVLGLRLLGPGIDTFDVSNSAAAFVTPPFDPATAIVPFRDIASRLAATNVTLDGAYDFEVQNLLLPVGAVVDVGAGVPATFVVLESIIATGGINVVVAAGAGGSRGFYTNLSQPGTPNAAAGDFFHALAAPSPQAQTDFNNVAARLGRQFST